MKPESSAGSPGSAGPTARGSDTARCDVERAAAHDQAALGVLDAGAGDDAHADLVELRAQRLARRGAEQRQRRVLGRVDRHVYVGAHPARLPRRHEGELVHGQRPRDHRRHDEGDARRVPLLEVAEQAAEQLVVGLRRPRERVAQRGLAARADRDEQRVVGEPVAVIEHDLALAGVDGSHARADEVGAGVLSRGRERMARGVPA